MYSDEFVTSGHSGVKVMCGAFDPPTSAWAAATGVVVTESIGGKTVAEIAIRDSSDIAAF